MSNPKLVIMFGSHARGTAGRGSDTDVAVLADHALNTQEKAMIEERLARKLGVSEEELDIVDLFDAPPLLAHQIGETGKLLEGERTDFVRFRVLAWKRYLGTAKFRRAREASLTAHVKGNNS